MKKFFAMMMTAALVAFSMTSCKDNGNEPDDPSKPGQDSTEVVKIAISEGIVYSDHIANDGWWQVMAQSEEYYVTLSNAGSVTKAAGKYAVKDLDLQWSYIKDLKNDNDSIGLKSGSIEVKEISKEELTFIGTIEGSNGKKYELNLHYTAPTAKRTVELDLGEGALDEDTYAAYGAFEIRAMASDYSAILDMIIIGEVEGAHSSDVDIADAQFGAEGAYQDIYQAAVTITKAAEDHYDALAEILCYNNTLYKVSFTLPIEVIIPPTGEQVNVEGLIATYIDDYRDYDGSYVIYFDDDENNPTKEIALNLFDDDFAGTFGNDDFDPGYSYYYDKAVGKLGIQAISVTATPGNSGHSLFAGYLIANNGIQYNFSVDVPYEDLLTPAAAAPARKAVKKSASASLKGFQAVRRDAKFLKK